MEFKIRNYRGISSADIELSTLTLVAGKNAAGKTSLIDAVRSVACANANPFREITKKEISMLVRSGTPSGYAEIINGENVSRIDWPKCEHKTDGVEVSVSPVATGIQSLVDMTDKDRINYIIKLMSASPTDTDLIAELKTTGIFEADAEIETTDFFKSLWEGIELNGWDVMNIKAKEKGIKRKGQWEDLTGVKRFGIRIAESYEPDAWSPDLLKVTEKELIADVNKATEWVEAAVKDTAISDFEKERLGAIANQASVIEKKMETIKTQQDVVEDTLNKKKSRIRELETGGEIRGLTCPECKTHLTLSNNTLKKIPKKEAITASKNNAEIAQHGKDIKSLDIQNKQLIESWGEQKSMLKVAKDAALKLKNIAIKESTETDAEIENVNNKLALAEERLGAYRQYNKSREIAEHIKLNQKLQDILAPTGLRNKKLTEAIKKINDSMRTLTDEVGWPSVELSKECNVLTNGVPYGRLIAKSERYRARVLLQLMVATEEKSDFVIIDDADELASDTRNELMRLIISSGMNCIVVCAMNEKKDMPDLTSINGLAYWIEGGNVV